MNKILTLSIHDFQMIFRDKILMAILFIPLLMIAIIIWGVPVIIESLAIPPEFYPLFVGVFSVVASISPAYIVSFIMLEEKDEDILIVMRTMPLAPLHFITYRILFIVVFGFSTSLITLAASGLSMDVFYMLLISLLTSFIAPITALAITTYSRNKIEGLTMLKGINFLIVLPVLGFFTGSIGHVFLFILPPYWVYHCLMNLNSPHQFFLFFVPGVCYCTVLTLFLIFQFQKRVFH